MNPFAPLPVPAITDCKCCDGPSTLVGVMDTARSGLDARTNHAVEALSGQAVYYHRCGSCGFTFTRAFDDFTADDFARHIYNADHARHDPAYANGERGTRTAADLMCAFSFGARAAHLSVLDWGSGEGSVAPAWFRPC